MFNYGSVVAVDKVVRKLYEHRRGLDKDRYPELSIESESSRKEDKGDSEDQLETRCGVRKFASMKEHVFYTSFVPQIIGALQEVDVIMRKKTAFS